MTKDTMSSKLEDGSDVGELRGQTDENSMQQNIENAAILGLCSLV